LFVVQEGETALDLAIANRFLSVARKIANGGGKSAEDVVRSIPKAFISRLFNFFYND